ncbi:MAG: hypothetical protein IPH49_04220 [Ignavibacteria bacterium]|nr:hypothetical protein [Ignavibacteria bacterium]
MSISEDVPPFSGLVQYTDLYGYSTTNSSPLARKKSMQAIIEMTESLAIHCASIKRGLTEAASASTSC